MACQVCFKFSKLKYKKIILKFDWKLRSEMLFAKKKKKSFENTIRMSVT